MAIEIKIPELGESITEVQIATWLVKEGDTVAKDQNLVSIESEKATVEIPAPEAGVIGKILQPDGTTVKVGDVIGSIEAGGEKSAPVKEAKAAPAETTEESEAPNTEEPEKKSAKQTEKATEKKAPKKEVAEKIEPEKEASAKTEPAKEKAAPESSGTEDSEDKPEESEASSEPVVESEKDMTDDKEPPASEATSKVEKDDARGDEIRPLSPLRRTVAKRLVEAQQTMAILTTFNEIDMSAVIALRKQYQEPFVAKSGVKLGFMSFFVKAVIEALKQVPQLNGEIKGNNIVYHKYFDIGVAVGAGKGLVVPPIRNAEKLSFAEIEQTIADLAARAKDNKLKPSEMEGGTFTISNGGIYGSLLSTPIINPPQSGILGLHTIQERPVVRTGLIVIRPMMYVALSYDHRIVDGREAVQFLVRVKDIIEDPTRLLLEI